MPPKKPCPSGKMRNPKTGRCVKANKKASPIKKVSVVVKTSLPVAVDKELKNIGKEQGVVVQHITASKEQELKKQVEQGKVNAQYVPSSSYIKGIGFWIIATAAGAVILYSLHTSSALGTSSWESLKHKFQSLVDSAHYLQRRHAAEQNMMIALGKKKMQHHNRYGREIIKNMEHEQELLLKQKFGHYNRIESYKPGGILNRLVGKGPVGRGSTEWAAIDAKKKSHAFNLLLEKEALEKQLGKYREAIEYFEKLKKRGYRPW